jgi:hypothetical protein
MRHGVCIPCAESVNDQKAAAVLERIKESWATELVGSATDKQFENVRKLKVEVYGHDKNETLKRFTEKKEKARIDKIDRAKNKS